MESMDSTSREDLASPGPGDVVDEPWFADVAAVMAVKRLDDAKSRLAASRASEPTDMHRALVLAMMRDTLGAVTAAGIGHVLVVSPDDDVLLAARAAGARGLREASGPAGVDASQLLNHAFSQAAAAVRGHWPTTRMVMMIQADLPAATAASLRALVSVARGHREAVLTDRNGTGTTILVRDTAVSDPPRFGADSAAAHRGAGAVELDPGRVRWPDLRTDVDTAADLEAADALGLGRYTAGALGRRSPADQRGAAAACRGHG